MAAVMPVAITGGLRGSYKGCVQVFPGWLKIVLMTAEVDLLLLLRCVFMGFSGSACLLNKTSRE